MSPIFTKSLVFIITGAGIAAGFYIFDYRKLEPYSRHIYLGAVSALFLVIIFGQDFNGKHYLSIGGIYLDVIEISPLLLCLALAGILNNWNWNQNIKEFQCFLLCVATANTYGAIGIISSIYRRRDILGITNSEHKNCQKTVKPIV